MLAFVIIETLLFGLRPRGYHRAHMIRSRTIPTRCDMDVSRRSKSGTIGMNDCSPSWPTWARRLATLALLFHFAAVLAGVLGAPPSSPVEQAIAAAFAPYHQAIDQGYSYRYYANPGPTPVVTARIHFADGRPDETLRLPERGVRPRLRYQRQLALANHLVASSEEARRATGDASQSVWARSYARHIGRSGKGRGCATITLFAQSHLIPELARVRDSLDPSTGGSPVDLDAEEFFTTPQRIGEFPCDGS